MNIYYLGPKGSYSYTLVSKEFPKDNLIPMPTFGQILSKVQGDTDGIGVLGIENSISSSVHESIDLIFNSNVFIAGEACMDIQLHLIGPSGARVNTVKEVFSYPQAIAQCSEFIQKNAIITHESPSTMAAINEVNTLQDIAKAAIAGRGSLPDTDLKIIKENIGNIAHNMTRWVFVSRERRCTGSKINKMSLIFKVKHEPGSLVSVLHALAKANSNMTKIESRPVPGSNWEYAFWIDIEIPEGTVESITDIMSRKTLAYRIVGAYEKGRTYHE